VDRDSNRAIERPTGDAVLPCDRPVICDVHEGLARTSTTSRPASPAPVDSSADATAAFAICRGRCVDITFTMIHLVLEGISTGDATVTDLHTRTHWDAMTGDAIARAFGAASRRLAPEHHSALVNASGRVADCAVTLTVTPRPRMLRRSCFATPTGRLETLEVSPMTHTKAQTRHPKWP
jgi:hypothetical protein